MYLQDYVGALSVTVSYLYLRYFAKISILLYLSDTGVMYLEYLTEDTFQSIFPNPAFEFSIYFHFNCWLVTLEVGLKSVKGSTKYYFSAKYEIFIGKSVKLW